LESEILIALSAAAIACALAAAGTTAIAFFVWSRATPAVRATLAAAFAPLLTLGPLYIAVAIRDANEGSGSVSISQDAAAAGVIFAMVFVIGWPIAFFLSRALDRKAQFNSTVFE